MPPIPAPMIAILGEAIALPLLDIKGLLLKVSLKVLDLRGLGAAGRQRGYAPSLYLLYRRSNLVAASQETFDSKIFRMHRV
jgi:hypothetical protein